MPDGERGGGGTGSSPGVAPHAFGAEADGAAQAQQAQKWTKSKGPVPVVRKLNNPRQLALSTGGTLLIAEAGKGGPTCDPSGETCIGTTGSVALVPAPSVQQNSSPLRIVKGLISAAGPDGTFAVGADGVSARSPAKIYSITLTSVAGVAVDRWGSVYASQLFTTVDPEGPDIFSGKLTRIKGNGARANGDVPVPAGVVVDRGRADPLEHGWVVDAAVAVARAGQHGEHAGDVAAAELGQAQLAEGRDEVLVDVGLVGTGADGSARGQPEPEPRLQGPQVSGGLLTGPGEHGVASAGGGGLGREPAAADLPAPVPQVRLPAVDVPAAVAAFGQPRAGPAAAAASDRVRAPAPLEHTHFVVFAMTHL